MLRFLVHQDGKSAAPLQLAGAYLSGSDGVPVRAEIQLRGNEITCRKRATGPAALAILWPIEGGGRVVLETTRLPERERPYVLAAELLRGRLMRIAQKREDWGLYEFEGIEDVARQIEASRDHLIHSLQAATPAAATSIAQKGLALGLLASEQLAAFHAEIFLNRRKQVGGFGKRMLGCTVDVDSADAEYRNRLPDICDHAAVPFSWKQIEPREREINWKPFDSWVEWLTKKRIPIRGARLVSFDEADIPPWLYVWEHDYETVRDLLQEHIRRVVTRYGAQVQTWECISGIHAHNTFGYNFEQLMELTRLSAAVTRQADPRSSVVIDLVAPWGEYYATNQRTIPPMMYAELAVQSGIDFDAFGVQLYCGVGRDGLYVRDLFQISSLLDRFANLGKPVHVTGMAVPSATSTDPRDAWRGKSSVIDGGAWHKDWSEDVQRAWLRRVCHIAMSKPFVESITWRDLADRNDHFLPNGGLLRPDFSAKPSYQELRDVREDLYSPVRRPAPATAARADRK